MREKPVNVKPTTEYKKFICQICGKEFERPMREVRRYEKLGREIKYCSVKCLCKSKDTRVEIECCVCGKKFLLQKRLANKNLKGRTCSPECAKKKHEEVIKPIEIVCKNCGKIFTVENSYYQKQLRREQNINYCSKECMNEYLRRNMVLTKCVICGKEFYISKDKMSPNGNACSEKCLREKQANLWHEVICNNCGKVFKVNDYKFRHQKTFYCNNDCKIVKIAKDKETYHEISHYLRTSTQYISWRDSIFKRDHYTCVKCGKKVSENLHAHHIKLLVDIVKEFNGNIQDILQSEIFNDINNGVTLCSSCHHEEHKQYTQINEKGQFMPLYVKDAEGV